LEVTESGTYTVIVFDEQCGSSATDEIVVVLGLEPDANPVDDIIICDDASGDGIGTFDLESQTATILGSQDASLLNVTYHLSQTDANTGTGALSSPYTNVTNPQTIYVRVEDANALFCIATTSFDLVISGPTPTITSVDYVICDDSSNDGFASFDLTTQDALVLGTQNPTDFTVSYYLTEAEAMDGTSGALVSPYTNIDTPQTIWVRIESNVSASCFGTGPMTLTAAPTPMTTFSTSSGSFEICAGATVPLVLTAVGGNYTGPDVSVVWYHDGGELVGETGLALEVLAGGLYEVEVTFTATGCSATVGQEVAQLEDCVIPQGISPNGDGLNETFDLSSFNVTRLEVFNRNGRLVYSRDSYTDQWHGQSDSGEELPVGTYFYTMVYDGGAS